MPDIVLPLIPKPPEGTKTVLKIKAKPGIRGGDGINYLCGNCGNVLISGTHEGQVRKLVFHCSCGAYNDLV